MPRLPGGQTQDEVMAVALFKMGLKPGDCVLDIGCGTGKVSFAAAKIASQVYAVDRRTEAIRYAKKMAGRQNTENVEFFCTEATDFLATNSWIFDCAFVGGSQRLPEVLAGLAPRVRRSIVVNAVLMDTVRIAVDTMQTLGIFCEVVHIQVSHSKKLAGSIMFRPANPVYIIVGAGMAC